MLGSFSTRFKSGQRAMLAPAYEVFFGWPQTCVSAQVSEVMKRPDHSTRPDFETLNDEQLRGSRVISVVIDTPRGSRNKFKFDAQHEVFRLSKILPEGMVFPYDFGFLPVTEGEDGDPLDVLVLVEAPTFPGCVVECRLVGAIEAEQQKRTGEPTRNDRLLAVATASLLYREIEEIDQIQSAILKDIEGFFVNYDRLRDIEFRVLGRSGSVRARRIISAAQNPSERSRHASLGRASF